MRINTNVNAMLATNNMNKNTALSGNSMEKLASGLRINSAGDDAAGLAISEKMRAQIRGMEQADRNVQDGISLVQTAEGALSEAGEIVQRMRELAVQTGNSTLNEADRNNVHAELEQLGEELMKISQETKFNDKPILAGGDNFVIQAGANAGIREIKNIDLKDLLTKEYDTGFTDPTSGDPIKLSFLGTTADIDATGTVSDITIDVSDVEPSQHFVAVANAVLE